MLQHTTPLSLEEAAMRLSHYEDMLEEVPFGMLLLDWDLEPMWFNFEAARASAVWNFGERKAAALRVRHEFKIPEEILAACQKLRDNHDPHELPPPPHAISEETRGLHARITLHSPGRAGRQLAFHIQLDHRLPRGDRNQQLSPGAVAMLARLSEREREVAMRVREGMPTLEIAKELSRSPLTIKTQLSSIFTKLEVHGRTKVAALLNR